MRARKAGPAGNVLLPWFSTELGLVTATWYALGEVASWNHSHPSRHQQDTLSLTSESNAPELPVPVIFPGLKLGQVNVTGLTVSSQTLTGLPKGQGDRVAHIRIRGAWSLSPLFQVPSCAQPLLSPACVP